MRVDVGYEKDDNQGDDARYQSRGKAVREGRKVRSQYKNFLNLSEPMYVRINQSLLRGLPVGAEKVNEWLDDVFREAER